MTDHTVQAATPELSPAEKLDLQDAADQLGHYADEWNPYDPMMSSSGQEYVTGPRSAGWYALFNGYPVKVEITYVTDEEIKHDVLMHLSEEYALEHAPYEQEPWEAEDI